MNHTLGNNQQVCAEPRASLNVSELEKDLLLAGALISVYTREEETWTQMRDVKIIKGKHGANVAHLYLRD